MPNDIHSWVDERAFFSIPVGFLVWIFWCVGLILLPAVLKNVWSSGGGAVFALIAGAFALIWLVLLGFFRYVFCPLKFFVAWKVVFDKDKFFVRGFYGKRLFFLASDILFVDPVILSSKQFGSDMGSLLSQPHPGKEVVNWKIILVNEVTFYLSAEMNEVNKLKDLLILLAKKKI